MNAAARLIFSSSKFHHITPLMHQLHWLKAPERIAFKHAVLVYTVQVSPRVCTCLPHRRALSSGRCRGSSATSFQFTFVTDCQPHPTVPTIGDRAFPVAAARVWNSLPDHVTSAPSVAVFRSRLETHLFNISYPSPL